MIEIQKQIHANITTLTFKRLEKKNSITSSMYTELANAFVCAENDPTVRVLVIQGHETIFSAGNDIVDFLQSPPTQEDAPVSQFLYALANFSKPLIAAVCGPAVGIGTTMLFHCDLVYAGENALFSMPFVNLGLIPEAASSLLAPQMFGYHRAAEMLLLGEPFNAEKAVEIGFVNKVLPPNDVNNYTQSVAKKLACKPLSSLIETKRLMKLGKDDTTQKRIDRELKIFGRMLVEPAAKEAFGAFMEKRKPDFLNCA